MKRIIPENVLDYPDSWTIKSYKDDFGKIVYRGENNVLPVFMTWVHGDRKSAYPTSEGGGE